MIRTHYDNLKVARNAPPEVIRAAYKTLSQKYHPDRSNEPNAPRIMAILNEAYEVLSNPEKRKLHDLWITQQESEEQGGSASAKHQGSTNNWRYEFPSAGCMKANQLSGKDREKLLLRMRNNLSDQVRIKTDGVLLRCVWSCILIFWFLYLYTSATEQRWSANETYWMLGITVVVGMLLGSFLGFILKWWTTPFKSFLFLTPLYIIKSEFDKVWFWPLGDVTDIRGTHNYRNGFYENTSLSLVLGGKTEEFTISPKNAYQDLVDAYKAYSKKANNAARNNQLEYFIDNDDFYSSRVSGQGYSPGDIKKDKASITFSVVVLASMLCFFGFYSINLERPTTPKAVTKHDNRPIYTPPSTKSPYEYHRPKTAPNGKPWPKAASYIGSYDKQGGGLSSVTVDNSRNDADVLVKLVSLSNSAPHPVRTFFIPAFGSFRMDNVREGMYDIRYRDLDSGDLLKSESFTVTEMETYSGTQYSNFTMTLYKVVDGNMQTYPIHEKDF